jgi:hypothetical protein
MSELIFFAVKSPFDKNDAYKNQLEAVDKKQTSPEHQEDNVLSSEYLYPSKQDEKDLVDLGKCLVTLNKNKNSMTFP